MGRSPRVSPDRILAAAALEFAARGFAGARVDRIARRAHVNKAMLYYHFRSKQHLYRTLLRRMFTLAAARLQAIAESAASPADKVAGALAAMAAFIEEHAPFPRIMLREVAEGGVHLDRDTLTALAAVPRAFGAIVHQGVESGAFRRIDPMFAYFRSPWISVFSQRSSSRARSSGWSAIAVAARTISGGPVSTKTFSASSWSTVARGSFTL